MELAWEPHILKLLEHEDINLITLLIGASASGLEVMGLDGNWNKVTADSEHIVMNCGDMLQRLTNHQLKSTTHRVVILLESFGILRGLAFHFSAIQNLK